MAYQMRIEQKNNEPNGLAVLYNERSILDFI